MKFDQAKLASRTGFMSLIGTLIGSPGLAGSTMRPMMPTRATRAMVRSLPSGLRTVNSGSGSDWPGTTTSCAASGSRVGGNSLRAARVLSEDRPSQRTGPNISSRPRTSQVQAAMSVQCQRPG